MNISIFFSNINALGIKFGLVIKRSRSTQIRHLCNLVGLTSSMLHTKSRGHWPFGSREEVFLKGFTLYGHVGHLGDVTTRICYKFKLRSLHMKLEFNWPSGSWENYVLIYWWDYNISDIGWKVNDQPLILELIYSHCLIGFNISSEDNDFGLNSIQKINFHFFAI